MSVLLLPSICAGGEVADENILALIHFDDNIENVVTGVSQTLKSNYIISSNPTDIKFGTGALKSTSDQGNSIALSSDISSGFDIRGDFTVAAFMKLHAGLNQLFGSYDRHNSLIVAIGNGGAVIWYVNDDTGANNQVVIPFNIVPLFGTYHNFEFVKHKNVLTWYVDGIDVGNIVMINPRIVPANSLFLGRNTQTNVCIDEFILTCDARHTANFTPPTKPYSLYD